MADKLLAEWFWVDRWDGSSASLLPMECQGVYRSMLSQAWRRGARLPNDHEAIQRAIRCTRDEWERCWPKIAKFWRVDGDDLVNDTQLDVYSEALSRSEQASERGRRGAQARAQARAQAVTQAKPEVVHKIKPPSPSPSPSPNTPPPPSAAVVGACPPAPADEHDQLVDSASRLVAEIVQVTGREESRVLRDASRFEPASGPTKVLWSIEELRRCPIGWLRVTVERLRSELACELDRRKAHDAPPDWMAVECDPTAERAWESVVQRLQPTVPRNVLTWVKPSRGMSIGAELVVVVPNSDFASHVEAFRPLIESAARAVGIELPIRFTTPGAAA